MRRCGFASCANRVGARAIVLVSLSIGAASAQTEGNLSLKSGESVELGPVYWVANCRSILTALPEVEILEGPPGVTLNLKEEMVLPRRQNCPNKVSGGILTASVGEVQDHLQGKLIYRIKYKTKDGDRQRSNTYNVSLFP